MVDRVKKIDSPDDDEYTPFIAQDTRECCPTRHVLAFLAFSGFVCVYALRVNLSVALVAMVNQTYVKHVSHHNGTEPKPECPVAIRNTTDVDTDGEFKWDENLQGIILGSFFYGYIFTQIPGGMLAEKYGGKNLFGFGVLCTAVLTLITPWAARTNVYILIAVRIIEGLGEGVTFPAMNAMWGKWAPTMERSKLGAFTYSGSQFGTVISLPISGLLCRYGFDGGWPSVFYVFGTVSCIWFIFWMLLTSDSPSNHPRISERERIKIETSIGDSQTYSLPPFGKIFSSKAVWAIIIAHTCNNWGFYTLLTCLPTYMKNVLDFDLKSDGFLSAIPYFCYWVLAILGSNLADYLRVHRYLTTTTVRKLFNTSGLVLPLICLVSVGYIGCDTTVAVILISMSVGFNGLATSGFAVNHLDIGSRYAGFLMGVTNSVATIPGMVGPSVVGILTNQNETRHQWQIVFYIAAAIYAFGAIMFLILASGEKQNWNEDGTISISASSERLNTINRSPDHLPEQDSVNFFGSMQ